MAAPPLLADDAEAPSERGIVAQFHDRFHRGHRRVDDHLVAHGHAADARAQFFHHAGHVAPGHVRQRGLGLAAGEPEVHVVEGAGHRPHHHLTGAGLGSLDLTEAVLPR